MNTGQSTIRLGDIPDYVWENGELVFHDDSGNEIRHSCRWKFKLSTRSERKARRQQALDLSEEMLVIQSSYEAGAHPSEWSPEHIVESRRINDQLKQLEDAVFDHLIGWQGLEDEFNDDSKAEVTDHPVTERSIREAFDRIGQGELAREGNSGTPHADGPAVTNGTKDLAA